MDTELDFRALFDSVPGLYLVLRPNDPFYTIVAVNKAYAQATLTKPADIVGRGLFEVFPDNPNDPHATGVRNLKASFRRVLTTRAADTMPTQKYDIRRPEEQGGGFEERYWSPTNSPLLGDDGQVRLIIHCVEDVTELLLRDRQLAETQRLLRERQEIEEKLLATEARFSMAFDQAPIGMVLLTPAGRIVETNQAFLNMLGYTREELIADNSAKFTHPDDVQPTRDFFASLRGDDRYQGALEKRYFRKGGDVLWARASVTMRRDEGGAPVQAIAIVEDITERKRAEERYRFLAESIPQMVWTASPDGMLDYVNGQGAGYFGVPSSALVGAGWLEFVHPEERQTVVERWTQSLATGAGYEIEFRLKRASDNSWRWHLVRALPLRGQSGNIVQWFGTCTDIEDQKQAVANLQQQWHTFDTALSHTPDFTYIFDLGGRFTYVNNALLALWQKTREQALGKTFFELDYPAELAARLQSQIQRVIDTKQTVRDQTPYSGPTGEARHYDYIFVPVLDTNGRIEAVAGSTRDITDQSLAARQIEEDRRRWRELLEQTPAAIAVLRGPEHTFEWVNPAYAELVARPSGSLIGKPVREALPEVREYLKLLNEVYETGQPFVGHESLVEFDRNAEAPIQLYLNFVYLPTRDAAGDIDGIFVHATDVTETVMARKRVEESERQFRTLAETIPHLAWMADEKGNRLWYNRRWYDYTGSTFEDAKDWGWERFQDPAMLAEVRRRWHEALSAAEAFEIIYPLKGADGSFRTFLTRVEPVKDSKGCVVRWFGTNTDITDQRRIEQELRRKNRDLEEFAYVASHDLQEPLRMVNIYTQQILKTIGTENKNLVEYSRFVKDGVVRMEALIRGLLSFSRSVHAEDTTVGMADLDASLAEALSVLKDRIQDAGAVITASPLPAARGETAQLSHVFQNVISNALKYRKPELTPHIWISATRENTECIISIRDNGIGFEPQYAERIFGLFKRLHKDEYPGTGLGLAICKRIIERYGGRMWAEGKLGEGATVYFALPCALEQ
jgi:PAS domain S-box-containing protein